MRFIIALFIPPLAVLLCGKPFQAIVNLLFWLASLPLLFIMGLGAAVWLICSVHALIVCSNHVADGRVGRLVNALGSQSPAVPPRSE